MSRAIWKSVFLFQLHHTGIKTDVEEKVNLNILYFNCTIQELKQGGKQESRRWVFKFQLHHTGIKTLY